MGDFVIQVGRPARVNFRTEHRNLLHRHTFFEPCLVTEGHGNFEHAGRSYDIGPGDLFVADPDVVHEIRSLRTRDLEVVFTSFAVVREAGDAPASQDAIVRAFLAGHRPVAGGQEAIVATFDAVFEALRAGDDAVRRLLLSEMMRVLALQLMVALTTVPLEDPVRAQGPIEAAVDAIEAGLAVGVSVQDVATAAGVSERTLRRLFERRFGRGVSDEIQRRRVLRASSLLALPDLSVTEIAHRVGVHDQGQFTRLFRKVMGVTPSEFRRMSTPASRQWAMVGDIAMRTEFVEDAR